jgi:hypothetical protein
MMPSYVALTTLTDRIRMEELARVAAALQTQITRDFAPHWCATAVIAAAPFEAIQAGYCPVIVQDTLETEGAWGLHRTESDEAPYIMLPYGPTWSLAASHAILQMLADPTGASRRAGPSPMPGQGTVEYLIDACAPCQDIASAYAIDGVVVSDFCTPDFFAGSAASGPSHSFAGALREALRPAPNGLLTWLADDRLLYQARFDETGQVTLSGGFSTAMRGRLSLRELVDMLTPDRLERLANARPTPALLAAQQNARRVRVANTTRYRDEIAWRFGHATRPLCERPAGFGVHGDTDDHAAAYSGGVAATAPHRANGEVQTTARTGF